MTKHKLRLSALSSVAYAIVQSDMKREHARFLDILTGVHKVVVGLFGGPPVLPILEVHESLRPC